MHPHKLKNIEKAEELAKTKKRNQDILESPIKTKQQVLERWGSGKSVAVTQKMLDAAIYVLLLRTSNLFQLLIVQRLLI